MHLSDTKNTVNNITRATEKSGYTPHATTIWLAQKNTDCATNSAKKGILTSTVNEYLIFYFQ